MSRQKDHGHLKSENLLDHKINVALRHLSLRRHLYPRQEHTNAQPQHRPAEAIIPPEQNRMRAYFYSVRT